MRQGVIIGSVIASVVLLGGCSSPFGGSTTDVKTEGAEVSVGNGNVAVKTGEGQVNVGGGAVAAEGAMTTKKVKKNVVVIFDASGSMNETLDGEKKIDIAKRSVNSYVDTLGTDVNLSLLAYGHVGSNSAADKPVSCDTIEEKYYLGPVNSSVVKEKVNAIPAKGWTPITKALDKAETILATHPGEDNRIILVSDGQETCGGNPVAAAQRIKTAKARVDVIGFDVEGAAETELKNISVQGGGGYISIDSANDFNVVINQGTLDVVTSGATVNIGADGKLDVMTDGAAVKMDGGNLDVKTDDATVKMVPGKAPEVGLPKGIPGL